MYIHIYVYVCIYMYMYICVWVCLCMNIHIHGYMHVYIHMCVHTYMCIRTPYTHMYICDIYSCFQFQSTNVPMCVHVYICVYTHLLRTGTGKALVKICPSFLISLYKRKHAWTFAPTSASVSMYEVYGRRIRTLHSPYTCRHAVSCLRMIQAHMCIHTLPSMPFCVPSGAFLGAPHHPRMHCGGHRGLHFRPPLLRHGHSFRFLPSRHLTRHPTPS